MSEKIEAVCPHECDFDQKTMRSTCRAWRISQVFPAQPDTPDEPKRSVPFEGDVSHTANDPKSGS